MKAVLVIGSPRGTRSASYVLGSELADGLRAHGASVDEVFAVKALADPAATARALDVIADADLVVLSFPLYVHSLPAPLTRLLELAAMPRAGSSDQRALAVIVQCGFPETAQCSIAVDICRLFAKQTGMRWSGALAMGMGGAMSEGFEHTPGGGARQKRALGAAASALAASSSIPQAVIADFAKPMLPRWLYLLFGNIGWRMQMRRNKAVRPIGYRPFEQA